MHKSGTWDGPGRAWNWSPGYRKETELQGVLALSRRGGAGRVLAEALGALAFPQSSTFSWIHLITPIRPPQICCMDRAHGQGTRRLQALWLHSPDPTDLPDPELWTLQGA